MRPSFDPIVILAAHAALTGAMNTGIFALMDAEPRTADECAGALGTDRRATALVLEVLAAVGVIIRAGDRYGINPDTSMASALSAETLSMTKVQFDHTEQLLRTGQPLPFIDQSLQQREASYRAYAKGMGEIFAAAATRLTEQLALTPQPRLILDVGCGSGVWSLAIAARAPHAHVTGLDFPKVLDAFVARAESLNMGKQISLLPGDMYSAELPKEHFDLAVIANVLRLESKERARKLMAHVLSAVRPGGWLLIVDALAAGTPEKELYRAIYALHLGLRTNIGDLLPPEQILGWMHEEGLTNLVEIDLGASFAAVGGVLGQRLA